MGPKQKKIVFLLLATIFNLLITILFFIIFLLGTVYFLGGYIKQNGSIMLLLPLVLAILASFFGYRICLKWASRKWNLE